MAVEELDLLKPSLVGEPTRMNEQYSCAVDISFLGHTIEPCLVTISALAFGLCITNVNNYYIQTKKQRR